MADETGRRRYLLATGWLAVVFVLVPLLGGGYYVSLGRWGAALICAGVVAAGAALLWVGAETRLRRRRGVAAIRLGQARAGTHLRVPYSRSLFTGYAVLTGVLALGCVAGCVALVTDGTPGGYLLLLPAAVFGSLPALMLTGRFAVGRLEISPQGVYQRGWTFESFLAWDDIARVTPIGGPDPTVVLHGTVAERWQRRQLTRLWRQDRLPERPRIEVPGKFVGADVTVLGRLLGFYAEHPAARAELGTEAALRRVHSVAQ